MCPAHFRVNDKQTGKIYTDLLEIQILELKKLPADVKSGDDLINWMRFFGGKSRKEFADMAQIDEYFKEAYEALEKLSADEQAKLEYEARDRAIRDYNSQMNSALRRGRREGEQSAIKRIILSKLEKGISVEDIADFLEMDADEVRALAKTE